MTSLQGALRSRFSTRRKALLALVLLGLAIVGWMSFIGAAALSGVATSEMDWDGDGTVTRGEIFQGFHAVVVSKRSEGQRECASYKWRRDKRPIRVDCRTTMAPAEVVK